MTPEGKIKAKVRKKLNALSHRYIFMPVQNGMGAPSLDYLCCVDGLFVAIETKAPGGKMTPRQEQTAKAIRDANGLVFMVDGEDALHYMMVELCRL